MVLSHVHHQGQPGTRLGALVEGSWGPGFENNGKSQTSNQNPEN